MLLSGKNKDNDDDIVRFNARTLLMQEQRLSGM